MQVAGQPNKRLPPIQRIHKAYRERCEVFADALGWDKNSIADWFEQFFAWQDIKAFFNKAGNEFD
jgi:N-acyl-L-homoserine lactone synthetase